MATTMRVRPTSVAHLPAWNHDGSSTGQAEGHNSGVLLYPRAIFDDPFRYPPHVLVLASAKSLRASDNPAEPQGFNANGSEPRPQGPYYTAVGCGGPYIGPTAARDFYYKCLAARVKIAGCYAWVEPGHWEYQVGPCRGIDMVEHLTISYNIMRRVTKSHKVRYPIDPMPVGWVLAEYV